MENEEITEDMLENMEEIRSEGRVNMMDRRGVQFEADQLGFYELVMWLEDYPRRYPELLEKLGEYVEKKGQQDG